MDPTAYFQGEVLKVEVFFGIL